jgi:hypothetical protein
MRLAVLALLASQCNGQPAPVTGPEPAPPPVADPAGCDAACVSAQELCPHPRSLAHCVGVCEASARNLTGAAIGCLAKVATCDQECTP